MRATVSWSLIPVALLALACGGTRTTEDLKTDLELLEAAQLELAPTPGSSAFFVSAAENVPTPAPQVIATPARKRAPRLPPPQEVQADAESLDQPATAPEIVTVAPSSEPVAVESPAPESAPAVRPQPIEPRFPVGGGAVYGTGDDRGTSIGGVQVVIRGGRTGRDPCAIHDQRGREPVSIMINNRIPGRGTFPRR